MPRASHSPSTPGSPQTGQLRDLVAVLRQQMYFWGRDVSHPSGNLLIANGLEKRRSAGLQGSSCYSMSWQGGRIELHGACVGWYADSGGFVFIRPLDRCYHWSGGQPPVPGRWESERLKRLHPGQAHKRARPFLDWWIHYEEDVQRAQGGAYRERCFRSYRRLPRSRSALPPVDAMKWLGIYRGDPTATPRVRHFRA